MFQNEPKIDLAAAAALFPGHPLTAAVWRWCRMGIRTRTGEFVFLEHVRAGGRLYTSSEAVQRFQERLAAADAEHFSRELPLPKPAKQHRRKAAIDHSRRRLARAGI